MRLIDADKWVDALEKEFVKIFGNVKRKVKQTDYYIVRNSAYGAAFAESVKDSLISNINAMPTVDAVPVVRCKDCRHFREAFFGEKYCNRPTIRGFAEIGDLTDDDFCSYGERRADDAEE